MAKSFAFSYDLLADDLIEDDDRSAEPPGGITVISLGRSRAGSGLVVGAGTGKLVENSGISLESRTLSPKPGVFVGIGTDASRKLGENLSLLATGKEELEFDV